MYVNTDIQIGLLHFQFIFTQMTQTYLGSSGASVDFHFKVYVNILMQSTMGSHRFPPYGASVIMCLHSKNNNSVKTRLLIFVPLL